MREYVGANCLLCYPYLCLRSYVVWVWKEIYAKVSVHLSFMVQSSTISPRYLEERIEAFIVGFRKVRMQAFIATLRIGNFALGPIPGLW